MAYIPMNSDGRLELIPAAKPDLSVVVAGDYCIREPAAHSYDFNGDAAAIVAPVKEWIGAADISILNLECPLSRTGEPIPKCGPNLRMPPERLDFIRAAGFNTVSLANNHIGDYGPQATLDTLEVLETAGIPYVGAGRNLDAARQPLLLTVNGKTIAILNYAENEFGGATPSQAGAAPLNLPANLRQLRAVVAKADITLVIIHGGTEYYPFPAPDRAEFYRALAEVGPTAIVSHHAHTPQGIELHGDVPIVYSTGNFFFPPFNAAQGLPQSFWNIGYAVKLLFSGNQVAGLEILPYSAGPHEPFTVFTGDQKATFVDYLNRLSEPLADAEQLVDFFAAHAARRAESLLHGHSLPISADYRGELFANTLAKRNLATCEAHAELQRTFLRLIETNQLGIKGKDKIPILAALTDATRQLPWRQALAVDHGA